jgi:microcystin degradation protein MlrC
MAFRILTAGFFHETHTFVAEVTRWSDFEVALGSELHRKRGDSSPTDGFLEECARRGFEIVPTVDARATPGGTVADAAFETFWREFEARARPALAAGVDALFLVLHGAMVSESHADAEGELLARIRALPGAAHLPLFGVLDLHANVTARMCALANGLVMYRENPHTDAKATACRAVALLARCLEEQRVPHMEWCRPPIVWAPPGTGTAQDPMRALEEFARDLEAHRAEIWACNIAAGFSFADTPDTGVSLSAIVAGPPGSARDSLHAGASLAWSLRTRGAIAYPPIHDVVAALAAHPPERGPVLLVEPADNIGAGAPGDGTGILRALLAHRIARSLVALNDPAAVAALAPLEPGGTITLPLGGRGSSLDAGPLTTEVTLVSQGDGRFALEDKQSHLASMTGGTFDMGPCAVVHAGPVTVLLTSRKTPPFDLGQFRSQGLEPTAFAVIGVKAAVAHRRAYDPIAVASHFVATPGPCSSELARFPWRRLARPVWPLEPDAPFDCRFS